MRPIRTTRQFERDLKRARRRGKDLDKLWEIIEILNHGAQLEPLHRAHRLSGDWHPFWECHLGFFGGMFMLMA